ncbi:ankyrin repeat domain-containing protein [Trichoderma austrokoningii]
MNIAVNIDFHSTLDFDLEDDKDFEIRLRSCCGLFISIYHGKIYFLHQTAREFLVDTELSTEPPAISSWHHSISMRNAHATLAELCVFYLDIFTHYDSPDALSGDELFSIHGFLHYSATFWNSHFHEANFDDRDTIIPLALRICSPISKSYSIWFESYIKTLKTRNKAVITDQKPQMTTDLLVAAHCGNSAIVKLLLEKGGDFEAKESNRGWTPLRSAVLVGHEAIVKLLLDKGADIEAKDNDGWTALLSASRKGNKALVELLLDNGADIEAEDDDGLTPLLLARREGIIELLERNSQG